MPLTRKFKNTILERINQSREFRESLLKESLNELLRGDHITAKTMLRDFINATITFKQLSEETGIGDKSLMRMLSDKGNPTLESISLIIKALEKYEHVNFIVSVKHKNTGYEKRI